MKVSNAFTLTRIALAPVFFVAYFLPVWFKSPPGSSLALASMCVGIPLLAFAEFTDFLDGHSARQRNEVSDFGKLFDPFADVMLHLTTFTCFMASGYLPPAVLLLVMYREFGQNFLRMIAAKKGTAIAARKGGKFKTVLYVTSSFVSLAQEALLRTGLSEQWSVNMAAFHNVGLGLYIACVVFAYISFADYLIHFGPVLRDSQ
ncbi:MAG: CDP-diacylglycerol--glycerol-3-phosphate 3-phosphatidyltransferase [Treponema sp.]|nr:CDP-diacylglycerol--glycerol-3-phosphate 3-phosphatidyltransferase [Treponema sp.]